MAPMDRTTSRKLPFHPSAASPGDYATGSSAESRIEIHERGAEFEMKPKSERAGDLRPEEIPAARRAYALHRAYPWLPTLKISTRLAHDHGLYDRRWKPYRCKRLRRMIEGYAECVNAGVRASA